MRHKRVLSSSRLLTIAFCGVALAVSGYFALAQFSGRDWFLHRGNHKRQAANNSEPTLGSGQTIREKARAWVYPATADMPAEIVVDNGAPNSVDFPNPYTLATGQAFATNGTWTYAPTLGPTASVTNEPDTVNRGTGAWPDAARNSEPGKINDYLYLLAQKNNNLAKIVSEIGDFDTLAKLPNLDTSIADPQNPSVENSVYALVNRELTDSVPYARWSFGTAYPQGTTQGSVDVSNRALGANQRYAVYIRFPSSSTTVNGVAHPNTDHVFVRVSWGADVNDPVRSRIFVVNFGQDGGFWLRLRSNQGEDRYFPYDGTNPITVTMYGITGDDVNDTSLYGAAPIIPADAVRLVPEALRGDIHAPAASVAFPLGSNPVTDAGSVQRTYFGRDETAGPGVLFPASVANANTNIGGFQKILFDPTKAYQPDSTKAATYNPYIADPSSSIRQAVFYCFEDDIQNRHYGKLIWRYVAQSSNVPPANELDPVTGGFTRVATVDDLVATAGVFVASAGFATVTTTPADQSYGTTYHSTQTTVVSPAAPTESATWNAALSNTLPNTVTAKPTYSVFVWIPARRDGVENVHQAHYVINAESGPLNVYLDQRNDIPPVNAGDPDNRVGTWRQLASGVRFPSGAINGNTVDSLGSVTLQNDVPADDNAANRTLIADAVQFVAESQSSNSVKAAPLVASVKWPSGTLRTVVYFATTDGHLWALDAIGATGLGNPPTSTLTTAYWVYPSISNPAPLNANDVNPARTPGLLSGLQDDPNYLKDDQNNQSTHGIDGDAKLTNAANKTFSITDTTPALSSFSCSPIMVTVQKGAVFEPYIVIGNDNGRLYVFDPAGRANTDAAVGPVGEPYPATISSGDTVGIPGTTRRQMTWPTLAHDKWLKQGATGSQSSFKDNAAVGYISASPSAPAVAPNYDTDRIIFGAGDGHVYAVDMSTFDKKVRISNPNSPPATAGGETGGAPRWQYPSPKTALDPIAYPGALNDANDKYVFTSGGRVYAINNPSNTANGTATLTWVYPFTGTPPGEPGAADQVSLDTLFTAPIVRTGVAQANAGNEVVFIANQDGRVFAFDSTQTGGLAPNVLWTSEAQATTRASAVFVNSLATQSGNATVTVNNALGILLPLDNGSITGIAASDSPTGGQLLWLYPDAVLGGVPLKVNKLQDSIVTPIPDPVIAPVTTSVAYRGADVTPANGWFYQGDEGDPNTGEVNGQMRAYADINLTGTSGFTVGERPLDPTTARGADVRILDVWNGDDDTPAGPWNAFALLNNTKSPYDYRDPTKVKPNSVQRGDGSGVVIYERGDRIYAAAWGAVDQEATLPPRVTFTLYSGTSTQIVEVVGHVDRAYTNALEVTNPITGAKKPAVAWVATVSFTLGRSNEQNSLTPGARYTVRASARLDAQGAGNTAIAGGFPTANFSAGQRDLQGLNRPDVAPKPRVLAVANPLALTTRSYTGTSMIGQPNVIGWVATAAANSTDESLIGELLNNGNRKVKLSPPGTELQLVPDVYKDVVAPVGMINHGSSGTYLGVDANGQRVPAFFITDRSNMYKLNQPLNNVRVDRREMRWSFNPNLGGVRGATGDVMNPLPWETFPNTVPNVSADYPDVDRTKAVFRGSGIDMANRGISLPLATVNGGTKTLSPLRIDLQVNVPTYQSANINVTYANLNGNLDKSLIAPMVVPIGTDPVNGGSTSAVLKSKVSPSAGYVGRYSVYIASTTSGQRQTAGQAQNAQQQFNGREDVYRQLSVGIGVPPDIKLHTDEETIDIGNVPHGLGFAPDGTKTPFAPGGFGPYNGAAPYNTYRSPWDNTTTSFFRPFTIKNQGNVNLVNVRVAKVVGGPGVTGFDERNPAFWMRLTSDQVTPSSFGLVSPPIFATSFSFVAGGAGNLGVITSLDHARTKIGPAGQFEINYAGRYGTNNFWPLNATTQTNPYVVDQNVLAVNGFPEWAAGVQPYPTVRKARPGDTAPQVMSLPDVAYGDPLNVLSTYQNGDAANNIPSRDIKPKVSVAIPLGTPVGTYSVSLTPFEDHFPQQWREWVSTYNSYNGTTDPLNSYAVDDNGILDVVTTPNGTSAVEGVSNSFKLKVTVRESRLTNGTTPGSYYGIDIRNTDLAFGANFQPTALRDRGTGNLLLWWASNRPDNFGTLDVTAPGAAEKPFFLFNSYLTSKIQPNVPGYGNVFDWSFETNGQSRWWSPLPANNAPFPSAIAPEQLFPRYSGDVTSPTNPLPLVPGTIVPNTMRHATPTLVQDDDPNKAAPPAYAFWQGAVYKTASGAAAVGQNNNYILDTRTFYTPLEAGTGKPVLPGSGVPYSFPNDPNLPKYSPKPLIVTDLNGNTANFLFWHGGGRGRSRLYYNALAGSDLTDATKWSRDRAMSTPAAIITQSDPTPIHRQVTNASGQVVDALDLIYTGTLRNRKQAETLLTRYSFSTGGGQIRLTVMPLPKVEDELMVREGTAGTYVSRDMAWLYRDPATGSLLTATDPNYGTSKVPLFIIKVNGKEINGYQGANKDFKAPTFDAATGKLYFDSALGGQVVVDPQLGQVTFTSVAPARTDRVTVTYVPQTLRLNTTRNEAGIANLTTLVNNNAGIGAVLNPLLSRAHVAASGSNSGPVAFLDRTTNPRSSTTAYGNPVVMFPGSINNAPATTSRLWLFYRKTDTNVTAPAAVYYKTMRLMVRLPKGVLLSPASGGGQTIQPNIQITGNKGPVEVDWVRGRLYFTEIDEGSVVKVTQTYDVGKTLPEITYRVAWGDEISTTVNPSDQTTAETVLPTNGAVNEGQVSAFKDPFQDKVWVFWGSTRSGTSDLFYLTLSPQFYPNTIP